MCIYLFRLKSQFLLFCLSCSHPLILFRLIAKRAARMARGHTNRVWFLNDFQSKAAFIETYGYITYIDRLFHSLHTLAIMSSCVF